VRKSEIFNRNSYSIRDFLVIKNIDNSLVLKDLLEKSFINSNIDSKFYFDNTNHYLLTNKSISSNSLLLDDKTLTGVTPEGYKTKKACPVKVDDILVGNNGSLGDCLIIKEQKNIITNSNLTLLRFKQEINTYYILGLLYTKWFKDYCGVISSKSGTQEFITRVALETVKIPFPTIKNNQNPENLEKLVSLIVQNIIHKEEQIKAKNKQIDELIEKELKENQKPGSFSYSYPRISEIKEETRLDTGLYEKEFKEIDFLIRNYEGGYTNFEDSGFKRKKGPNLAISVIGRSYYSDTKHNKSFKQLVLSKHVTDEGGLKTTQYIGSSVKLPTLKRFDFLLFARGDIGRVILIDDFLIGSTSNFDVFFISSEKEPWENVFTLCYLKYLREIRFWEFYGVGGSGASSLTDYYFKKVNLPNFPETKQQEIAKLYYNPFDKNNDLTLGNYLENEKARNQDVGIFQLNMEIFTLRERLEDLVDKIVMEEDIEITLS
jgi:hypothetical protein